LLRRARLKSYSGSIPSPPRRRAIVLLLFGLFIVPSLAPRRPSRAQQTDRITALREHYHEQPTSHGVAEQHEALLTLGVVRVLNDSTQWITEHGDGFIEGGPVLGTIGACLTSVPFEAWAKFHLACSVTRGRAPEQCPKIQTGAPPPRTLNNGVRPVRTVTRA